LAIFSVGHNPRLPRSFHALEPARILCYTGLAPACLKPGRMPLP